MRRAPRAGHTYGNHKKTAEDYRREADEKAAQAKAKIDAKIEDGSFTRVDELEYIRTLEAIQTEFTESLISLYKGENPG